LRFSFSIAVAINELWKGVEFRQLDRMRSGSIPEWRPAPASYWPARFSHLGRCGKALFGGLGKISAFQAGGACHLLSDFLAAGLSLFQATALF
jgi:hypothetical protein